MPPGEPDVFKALRILHVLDHVRNIGNGITNLVVDLACAQQATGHRVAVASAGGEYETLLAAHGVAHVNLVREDTIPGRARVIRRLGAVARAVRPDVVNAHRPFAVIAGRIVRPVGGYALVATDHNEFEGKGRYLRAADLIIAVSEGAAAALTRAGARRDQIRVVPNGPLGGARERSSRGAGRRDLQRPAIVTVAGLVRRKGIYELLSAFDAIAAAHPAAQLYYVGDGPERQELEAARGRTSNAARIHIEGFSPAPETYLRAADIFVLPSLREPFGLAALEARAAGCAVIASDVDGLPEVLDHGAAGILVPPGDADGLARALDDLLSSPERLAHSRTQAVSGLGRFSAGVMATATQGVYLEALDRRRR